MTTGVLIATYNGEKFIIEQLESIINQSVAVDEIIISDDDSTDRTIELVLDFIEKHKNYNIKLFKNNDHGFVKNFENAFLNSSADILFFCDQDDIWNKDKVEIFKKAFEENDKINLVFSNADIVDENKNVVGITNWDSNFKIGLSYEPDENIFLDKEKMIKMLPYGNYVTGMSMAVRRTLLEKIVPFNKMLVHDDYITIMAAYYDDGILAINSSTALYRQHSNNTVGFYDKNGTNRRRKKRKFRELKNYCFKDVKSILNWEERICLIEKLFPNENVNELKPINNVIYDRKKIIESGAFAAVFKAFRLYTNSNLYSKIEFVNDIVTVIIMRKNERKRRMKEYLEECK